MGRLFEKSLAIVQQNCLLTWFDFGKSQHINIANYEQNKDGRKRRLENHLAAQNNAFTNRLIDDSQKQLLHLKLGKQTVS